MYIKVLSHSQEILNFPCLWSFSYYPVFTSFNAANPYSRLQILHTWSATKRNWRFAFTENVSYEKEIMTGSQPLCPLSEWWDRSLSASPLTRYLPSALTILQVCCFQSKSRWVYSFYNSFCDLLGLWCLRKTLPHRSTLFGWWPQGQTCDPATSTLGRGEVVSSALSRSWFLWIMPPALRPPWVACRNPREASAICKLFHPWESVSFCRYSFLICVDYFSYPWLG